MNNSSNTSDSDGLSKRLHSEAQLGDDELVTNTATQERNADHVSLPKRSRTMDATDDLERKSNDDDDDNDNDSGSGSGTHAIQHLKQLPEEVFGECFIDMEGDADFEQSDFGIHNVRGNDILGYIFCYSYPQKTAPHSSETVTVSGTGFACRIDKDMCFPSIDDIIVGSIETESEWLALPFVFEDSMSEVNYDICDAESDDDDAKKFRRAALPLYRMLQHLENQWTNFLKETTELKHEVHEVAETDFIDDQEQDDDDEAAVDDYIDYGMELQVKRIVWPHARNGRAVELYARVMDCTQQAIRPAAVDKTVVVELDSEFSENVEIDCVLHYARRKALKTITRWRGRSSTQDEIDRSDENYCPLF